MKKEIDMQKLENQLCFPLYACSKEIVRSYKPFLDPLDLTYTQYITMMVLWEEKVTSVKALGEKLLLDSGTLTPVLKKLESKSYIIRERDKDDERSVIITITKKGEQLKRTAADVPLKMCKCVNLDHQEAIQLNLLLHKMLKGFNTTQNKE